MQRLTRRRRGPHPAPFRIRGARAAPIPLRIPSPVDSAGRGQDPFRCHSTSPAPSRASPHNPKAPVDRAGAYRLPLGNLGGEHGVDLAAGILKIGAVLRYVRDEPARGPFERAVTGNQYEDRLIVWGRAKTPSKKKNCHNPARGRAYTAGSDKTGRYRLSLISALNSPVSKGSMRPSKYGGHTLPSPCT